MFGRSERLGILGLKGLFELIGITDDWEDGKLRSSEREEGICAKSQSRLAALSGYMLLASSRVLDLTLCPVLRGARTLSFAWFIGGNIAPLSEAIWDPSVECARVDFCGV